MIKSNKVKNSTFSSDFLLLIATMLPILMVITTTTTSSSTPMPLSLSSVAFASHGDDYHGDRSIFDIAKSSKNNNQVGGEDRGGLIGNLISQQQSPQVYARNVNEDNKMIIVENCEGEGGEVIINDNDKIIQTNTQSFNQDADNQVGEEEEEEEEDG